MIIGFGGNLSGGKTVTCVMLAYQQWLLGKKIISNITLNFGNNKNVVLMKNSEFVDFLIRNFEQPDKIKEMFFNSVLILDEITNLLSARKSTTNLNELITNFIMMAGKLDCDVLYTYQILNSQVDKRLREICNIFCECYRVDSKGQLIFYKPRVVREKIYIKVIMEIEFGIFGIRFKQFTYDPEPFYQLYDTREVTLLNRAMYQRGGSRAIIK